MPGILEGLRVVEYTAFVAAPLAGLSLAQLGADVIRVDLGGNLDINRWPLTRQGNSLYWAGLNKGKRSVTLDIRRPEGQALLRDRGLRAGRWTTSRVFFRERASAGVPTGGSTSFSARIRAVPRPIRFSSGSSTRPSARR